MMANPKTAADLRLVEPAPAPSDPGDELSRADVALVCHGLAFAMRPMRRGTEQITRTYDLGPKGVWVLGLISSGVIHPHQLAKALCCGRSLITAELTRLSAAGLIESSPDPDDRRRARLRLTASGEAACQQFRDTMWNIVTANLAGYSPSEVRLLARMLRDVRGPAADGSASV